MTSAQKSEEGRRWCEHLKRWHSLAGVCRWCAKMELRRPQFNFTPRHPFATELPEETRRRAAEAFERALRGILIQAIPRFSASHLQHPSLRLWSRLR